MLQFRTELKVPAYNKKINYDSTILLIGSCFSENIQQRFSYFKFKSFCNPFGIIYNPVSISKSIERIVIKELYKEDELIEYNDSWLSFDHHSFFSGLRKEDVLEKINSAILYWNSYIKNASHIFITLGTSWVYRYKKENKIVGNCHKFPSTEFLKELLEEKVIENSLQQIIDLIYSVNEQASIVFTISPVRHLKDGFMENQLSKSLLFVALNKILRNNQLISYFPSYEIIMDDLRDYRFYEADMIHPNLIAIDYIWEQIKATFMNPDVSLLMEEIKQIKNACGHRPFNVNSSQHQSFVRTQLSKIDKLENKLQAVSFQEEKDHLEKQLL